MSRWIQKTQRTSSGEDFTRINGNGYVPALALDDGQIMIEGPAIVQYLADLDPDSALIPKAGTMERTQIQLWLNFITSELHKPMAMLFKPAFQPARAALLDHLGQRLDWLSSRFVGPYLVGERFTVADAYLFVCLNWSPWLGIDLTRWPALPDFVSRVGARPKVQEALKAEGLGPHETIFHAPQPNRAASADKREVTA